MRPPEEVKAEIVRQWLAKADQDMQAGEALLSATPPFLFPACFHAQQAAEKYLKALLTWHQIEFPKTHAIAQLLELLKPAVPDVVSALREAVILTPFGVDVRYPGDQPEPTTQETRQALDLARAVRQAILPLLPRFGSGRL
jgi:HEPN domain-containing protein